MRDIKFRAWEKNLKEIISVDSINFEAGLINMELAWRTFEEIELMQYTGMKDKNGVEVYDGDIIREDIEKGGPPIIVSVVWEDGAFYGKERTHDPEYLLKEFLNGEVIGNIYENPELLEG